MVPQSAASMDCVVQIVMQVVLRSICRLHEVFGMAMELGAAILTMVWFQSLGRVTAAVALTLAQPLPPVLCCRRVAV
uniref:Uncharacterized protein n=1 Tax=Oryza rufipogon TaxID=4529 RepID=A0A0E0R6N2_ORYRU